MHREDSTGQGALETLERSIEGGLGPGRLCVVAARQGVGKTAVLVGIALENLLRGRKVLHVSLEQAVEKSRRQYDEIFAGTARERGLENDWSLGLDLERNRRIHNYLDNTFTVARMAETLESMRSICDFRPQVIVLDGYDFNRKGGGGLSAIRDLAGSAEAEIWMSAAIAREPHRDAGGIPEPLAAVEADVDVILEMAHDGSGIRIRLLKGGAGETPPELSFDPSSRLVVCD